MTQFVMLPRALLESAAWQARGLNAGRLIDFLILDHLHHGGKRNGFLLAPRRQLEEFGIGARFIGGAIQEAETLGLIDCSRGVGRRPNLYALTWLPICGEPPSCRFRECDAAAEGIVAARKAAKRRGLIPHLVSPNILVGCPKGSQTDCQREVIRPVVTVQREVTTMTVKGKSPYIGPYQGLKNPYPAASPVQHARGGTVRAPRRRPGKPYPNGHDE